MKYKKGYQIRDKECEKRDCFVAFSGNGIKICRLYEMGQCPEKYTDVPEEKIKSVEKIACKECKTKFCVNKNSSDKRSLTCILYSVNWSQPGLGKLERRLGITK